MSAVQLQCPAQGMPHADDAVRTLHSSEKPERPHDVRPRGGEWTAAQDTVEGEAVPLNMERNPLTAKAGRSNLNLKGLPGDLQLWVFQPPRLVL